MNKCKSVWHHLKSWPELYVALPLALIAIPGAAYFSFFLTGRSPQEGTEWLVDLSARVAVASLIVLFTSFIRQASGVWMSKEEQFAHPFLALQQNVVKMFCIGVFAWLFVH